jgi:glycosyltransferase involved in cell wall biosynthesis
VLRYRARLRTLAGIILVSACQYRFFADAGVATSSIHLVPHGIDTEFFHPLPETRHERFTVLFVGSYRRDFGRLGRICAGLERDRDISIRVAAPSGTHHRIPKLGNITLLPRLSDAELRNEYQRAHCLLMPVESATANNAVLEGLACGLPVVADAIDGIPEYAGEESGILIRSRKPEDFVRAILMLKSSVLARQEMSFAARRQAEKFAWPLVANEMMEIYREWCRRPC